jgi:heme/copper-type cytochrome/quinol oxidase subunit 3
VGAVAAYAGHTRTQAVIGLIIFLMIVVAIFAVFVAISSDRRDRKEAAQRLNPGRADRAK